MTDAKISSSLQLKIFSSTGVLLFCYLVSKFSTMQFIGRTFLFFHSSQLFPQLEQHFWQFLFSFLAIGFLSRGHLWSYGITSKNLKSSACWLGILYAGTILLTVIFFLFGGKISSPVDGVSHHIIRETVFTFLIYWMSSPVANQLLFFGLVQTVLMKQWGDTLKIFGFPLPVIASVIVFVLCSSIPSFAIGSVSFILVTLLGIFCGFVYWKTGSLITPMLGHAFYFGLPMVVEIVRSNFL